MATETGNKGHSAAFPVDLPAWFIKLFTLPGDVVLDPFAGVGTTGVAAKQLGRFQVQIEKESEYVARAAVRISQARFGEKLNESP